MFLESDIDQAVTRSHKSFHEIVIFITNSHPEITLPEEEWSQLDEKTQSAILERVKRTLEAIR